MSASDWKFLFLFFAALLAAVALGELVRRFTRWTPEATRKLVHILVGVIVATTPAFLESKWPMLILGLLFTALDFYAVRKGLFPGMHGTNRQTYGTVFYPLSFVILVLWLWESHKGILVASMLVMAVADALAAIVGEKVRRPHLYHLGSERKSIEGSATMFVVSASILWLVLAFFPEMRPETASLWRLAWIAGIAAVVATACEAVSAYGSDNLTVPLGTAFALYYMLTSPASDGLAFTFGLALALVVALASFRVRFLDASGSAAVFLLATVIFGIGRWSFAIPILAFFILSSLLSKFGKAHKASIEEMFEKSSRRDLGQVVANGGLAGLLVLLWYFSPRPVFFWLYAGSLAAATADTWATEIGILASRNPRSILTWKSVPPGTSGGVSWPGTLGALIGATVLIVVSSWVRPQGIPAPEPRGWVLLVAAGFLASLVDSLLGATLQAQFRCPACGKITEKERHCGDVPTESLRGLSWLRNDGVNFVSAASAVGFILLGFHLLS